MQVRTVCPNFEELGGVITVMGQEGFQEIQLALFDLRSVCRSVHFIKSYQDLCINMYKLCLIIASDSVKQYKHTRLNK